MASGIITPSYKSGFYSPKRGGVPKHPGLWRGCVGAWCPALGNTGATLFDQSLSGNHGTFSGMDAATGWIVGSGYRGLNFDGVNDYVALNPIQFSLGISIMAWIAPSGGAVNRHIFSQDAGTGSARNWITRVGTTDAFQFLVWNTTPTLLTVTSAATIADNQFAHVACTWDAVGSGVANVYVNGVLSGTGTLTGPPNTTLHTASAIGGRGASTSTTFIGNIYDVRAHNRVLGISEILTHYAGGPGIGYQLKRAQASKASAAAFKAYWARRQSQVIGGGVS